MRILQVLACLRPMNCVTSWYSEATFYGSNGVSDPAHSLVLKDLDPDPVLDAKLTRHHGHLQDRLCRLLWWGWTPWQCAAEFGSHRAPSSWRVQELVDLELGSHRAPSSWRVQELADSEPRSCWRVVLGWVPINSGLKVITSYHER